MEIPPSSSFTYEFDLVNTKIQLIYNIWENILDEDKLIENNRISTNIIKICTNKSEKNARNHDLNIHVVEVVIKESKANGNNNIRIFSNIYLIEYEKSKLINPKLKKLFNMPSKEKKLNVVLISAIYVEFESNVLKDISSPDICEPKTFKISVKTLKILRNSEQRNWEKLIQSAIINTFTKNWYGFST